MIYSTTNLLVISLLKTCYHSHTLPKTKFLNKNANSFPIPVPVSLSFTHRSTAMPTLQPKQTRHLAQCPLPVPQRLSPPTISTHWANISWGHIINQVYGTVKDTVWTSWCLQWRVTRIYQIITQIINRDQETTWQRMIFYVHGSELKWLSNDSPSVILLTSAPFNPTLSHHWLLLQEFYISMFTFCICINTQCFIHNHTPSKKVEITPSPKTRYSAIRDNEHYSFTWNHIF